MATRRSFLKALFLGLSVAFPFSTPKVLIGRGWEDTKDTITAPDIKSWDERFFKDYLRTQGFKNTFRATNDSN